MNKLGFKAAALVLSLTAAVLVASASDVDAVSEANVVQRVQSAKTPADHEAIARYYNELLSAARAGLDRHRKLKEGYRRSAYASAEPGVLPMDRHCDQLIRDDEDAVKTYTGLHDLHWRWGKQLSDTGSR
ncbi:MAG: hypothetical protein ISP90_00110 [Nevskia sp.]|nr:hypothetical protein [Nevskia sp.]